MALVNLSLQSFFNSDTDGDDRFVRCAAFITRRLVKAEDALQDMGLCFEAGEAGSLARQFSKVEDGDDFASVWNDLTDWAGADVYHNGKDQLLSRLPHLPDRFAC